MTTDEAISSPTDSVIATKLEAARKQSRQLYETCDLGVRDAIAAVLEAATKQRKLDAKITDIPEETLARGDAEAAFDILVVCFGLKQMLSIAERHEVGLPRE